MSPADPLLRAVMEASPEELPALIGELEAARALAWRRLTEQAAAPRELRLLSVDEASELARLPRRRLFSLARRAPWALRVGRRLLVEETGFRKALASGLHVRGEHERAREAPKPPSKGGSHVVSRTFRPREGR